MKKKYAVIFVAHRVELEAQNPAQAFEDAVAAYVKVLECKHVKPMIEEVHNGKVQDQAR